MIRSLVVGHWESPWMHRVRWGVRFFCLGAVLGVAIDIAVRVVVG